MPRTRDISPPAPRRCPGWDSRWRLHETAWSLPRAGARRQCKNGPLPADIGSAEENIVITYVPKPRHMIVNANSITAMYVHHAFGLSGGPARIKDVKRIFRIHHFSQTLGFLRLYQFVEIHFAFCQFDHWLDAPQHHNFFHQ